MLCNVKGIVLKSAEYGDNDKLLTLLTHEMGKMLVCVKGARSMKSKHLPSCEIFAYSEFQLYERCGKYWVRESFLCESFFQIRRSLENMYLGQYLCELTGEFALYDVTDEPLLRLLLNSLYLLCSDKKDVRTVKAAFELKSASVEGFLPDITGCRFCGAISDTLYFEAIEGSVVCPSCKNKINLTEQSNTSTQHTPVLYLNKSLIDAMSYIIESPIERVFSFKLPDAELSMLSRVCEVYILHQLERGFKTLDFFNSLHK